VSSWEDLVLSYSPEEGRFLPSREKSDGFFRLLRCHTGGADIATIRALEDNGASTKILVADDDPVILRLLQVNFGLEGFEVHTASRGEEALERAREMHPDIILLDVMMPGLDGWAVCQRLKEDERFTDTPIVFLSARAQDEDRKRGYGLGVAAYVTKPFDPGRLVELVRRLISAD